MKKFNFSLEKLLRYKQQLLNTEQLTLSEMNAVRNRLYMELDNMEKESVDRRNGLNEILKKGTNVLDINTHRVYIKGLDQSIEFKKQQILRQNLIIDKQTEIVKNAKLEVSMIEKLKESRFEEYQKDMVKSEELFIEEFVNNLKSKEL